MASFRPQVPPIRLECAASWLLGCIGWVSKPFYSHVGGYKLQLLVRKLNDCLYFVYMESEFPVVLPCKQQITMRIIDQDNDKYDKIVKEYTVTQYNTLTTSIRIKEKYVKNNQLVICVDEVETL